MATECCWLLVVGCLLFVVCCLLFVVCCLLFVVCCLLFVVCCLLFVVCCLLFVVCCLLFVVCCLLFVVCCLLFVVCCLLFVVCCLLLFSTTFDKVCISTTVQTNWQGAQHLGLTPGVGATTGPKKSSQLQPSCGPYSTAQVKLVQCLKNAPKQGDLAHALNSTCSHLPPSS